MNYCAYCGARIDDGASFCPNCGARIEKAESFTKSEPIDSAFTGGSDYSAPRRDYTGSTAIAVLAFLVWPAGLICWLAWKDTQPGKANSALKGLWVRLCFDIPLAGIIGYFIFKDTRPDFAKAGIIAAIVGFAIGFVWGIIFGIYYIAALESAIGGSYALAPLVLL